MTIKARPAPNLEGHQIGWFVMIDGTRYYSREPDEQAAIRECLHRSLARMQITERPNVAACNRILDELEGMGFAKKQAG